MICVQTGSTCQTKERKPRAIDATVPFRRHHRRTDTLRNTTNLDYYNGGNATPARRCNMGG